jgi:hypothetical protein
MSDFYNQLVKMFTSTTTTKTIVGKYDTETLSEKRYDPSFKGEGKQREYCD